MRAVLEAIIPSEKEERELSRVSSELHGKLESKAKQIDPRLYARLLGSSARGTWLRYEKDLDLFVLFPEDYTKGRMERLVAEMAEGLLSGVERHYAEHPYIRGKYRGYEVELVPCYSVASPKVKMSAVDRTPFHHDYVKGRIEGKENEVRLLKQFLISISCYGAEARVQGFSGYLSELLIVKFGSFESLLKAAKGFKFGEVLSLGKVGKHKLKKFRGDALIFIDPIDEERNVASALSGEKFALFIHASRTYLSKPSERFFFPMERKVSRKELIEKFKARGSSLLAVSFPSPEVVEDILYPQVRKALKKLSRQLELNGFILLGRCYYVSREVTLLFELQSLRLPEVKFHSGPQVGSGRNEQEFLKKYSRSESALCRPFISGRRWAVYIRRKFTTARECLESLLKGDMPKHLSPKLKEGYSLYIGEEVVENVGEEFLAGYLDPLFPWEY